MEMSILDDVIVNSQLNSDSLTRCYININSLLHYFRMKLLVCGNSSGQGCIQWDPNHVRLLTLFMTTTFWSTWSIMIMSPGTACLKQLRKLSNYLTPKYQTPQAMKTKITWLNLAKTLHWYCSNIYEHIAHIITSLKTFVTLCYMDIDV